MVTINIAVFGELEPATESHDAPDHDGARVSSSGFIGARTALDDGVLQPRGLPAQQPFRRAVQRAIPVPVERDEVMHTEGHITA